MKVRFMPASDTRENWLAKNPVALPGEICVEIDTGRWKFGDGRRPYSELPYATQDYTQEFFEMQKLAAEMQDVVDAEAEREALYQQLLELADQFSQARNIAVGPTAPTSTDGYSEGDIFLVVP